MALALGGLYVAGGVIGSSSLLLPHPDHFNEGALWTNIALAFAAGAGLLALRKVVPLWFVQLAVLAGIGVVTRAVYYGHDPTGFYTYWYLWIGVYAFFFFGRLWGAAYLGASGLAYAWALTVLPEGTSVAAWAVTIGSIGVAGLLVDYLARRLRSATTASERRARNLEAVGEVARQLATQSDARAVGWAICSAALHASGASVAVLWRPTGSGSELKATSAAGEPLDGARIPFIAPRSGAVQVFTGAEARFSRIDGAEAAQELSPRYEAGAAYWEPVRNEGGVVGVLAVYWADPVGSISEEATQALHLLSLETAIAIERGELLGRLEEAARTDDLTGLLNRRAWSSELSRELSRADRNSVPLCVAILDLDRFKQYNDEHGHLAGDRFLKQVSSTWSTTVRAHDVLARYGGEEFALAMPETDLDRASEMLERLREGVPEAETCSAGVCEWDGSESAEDLLGRADAALYEAKSSGRDRVTVS